MNLNKRWKEEKVPNLARATGHLMPDGGVLLADTLLYELLRAAKISRDSRMQRAFH
ncbi:hypothetical protein BY996DRAFT_6496073 [Phakopsora pachyrhizi]|nr:hypothetical protein BY996DRAFT_6496073 [Phakopsora pachyrhizi]